MPHLDVGHGHKIYYEEHGAPTGRRAVVLHGGPGGGFQRSVLRLFDLRRWRVVLFDQRGCGRSEPSVSRDRAAGLRHNTTWDLVEDVERLREAVGCVGPWTVFGGSWGSTLALAYASRYPASVAALVLRGIYLGEPWEAEWLYAEGGASRMAPQEWVRFSRSGRTQRKTMRATMAHYGRAFRQGGATRKAAARAWNRWESALSTLRPRPGSDSSPESMAIIEHHYFSHNCWLKPGQLLAAARLLTVPTTIIQGRYDLVCPPASAVALHDAMPHSRLILTHAGHAASEPETAAALRVALARLARSI